MVAQPTPGMQPLAPPGPATEAPLAPLPVKPNTRAIPYNIRAELMAPIIRNFIPASLELRFIKKAAKAANGREVNSREM